MIKNAPFFLLFAVLTVGLLHTTAYSVRTLDDEDAKGFSGKEFNEVSIGRKTGGPSGSGDGVYAGGSDQESKEYEGEYTDQEKKKHKKPPAPDLLTANENRKKELKKALKTAAATGKGAVYGGVVGAVVGGVLGSVVPVLGTAAGVALGATAGAAVGACIGWFFGKD